WQSNGQDGSGWGIYARRYNSSGTALGNEFRVTTTTNGNQDQPSVAMAPDGRIVIAWRDDGHGNNKADVWAQRYTSAGVAAGSEFLVNSVTPDSQDQPSVAMDGSGNFVIVWRTQPQGNATSNVFA